MAAAIGAITLGGLLVASALKGVGITELFSGVLAPLNPAGGRKIFSGAGASGTDKEGNTGSISVGVGVDTGGTPSGTPKHVIDDIVLPIARAHGINRTTAQNDAANASHGPTVSGGRSDHQGPPSEAWAADMSNGSSPTPQMDSLARALANKFDIPWSGSGAVSATHGHYRYQMIYRSNVGGNHYNHVHLGIRRVG